MRVKSKIIYTNAFDVYNYIKDVYGLSTPLTREALLCGGVQLPIMFKKKDGGILKVDFYKSRPRKIVKHLYYLVKLGVPVKGKLKYVKVVLTEE